MDQEPAFDVMAEAIQHYVKTERWWCECFLAMPDHWHALLSFPNQERMADVLRDWKRYVAKKAGVVWQDGFFEHRLRSAENVNETWRYIRENPVRENLCAKAEDWPWVWTGRAGYS